jgi:hypothetical protein
MIHCHTNLNHCLQNFTRKLRSVKEITLKIGFKAVRGMYRAMCPPPSRPVVVVVVAAETALTVVVADSSSSVFSVKCLSIFNTSA